MREGSLVAIPFDATRLEITGAAIPLPVGVDFSGTRTTAAFSISNNGVLTARSSDTSWRLHLIGIDGKVSGPLLADAAFSPYFDVALDDDRVVLPIIDRKFGTMDLWLYTISRGTRQRLTFESDSEGQPIWSRAGSRIYYWSDRKGWPEIFEKTLVGGKDRLIVEERDGQYPRSISADGRFLLYETARDSDRNSADLYVKSLSDNSPATPIAATEGANSAQFSPSGRWVAYSSDETGQTEIYVSSFPQRGGPRQISTSGASWPHWSRDGRRVYFARARTIVAVDFDDATGAAGKERSIVEMAYDFDGFVPLADGRLLVRLNSAPAQSPENVVITNWPRMLKK